MPCWKEDKKSLNGKRGRCSTCISRTMQRLLCVLIGIFRPKRHLEGNDRSKLLYGSEALKKKAQDWEKNRKGSKKRKREVFTPWEGSSKQIECPRLDLGRLPRTKRQGRKNVAY